MFTNELFHAENAVLLCSLCFLEPSIYYKQCSFITVGEADNGLEQEFV